MKATHATAIAVQVAQAWLYMEYEMRVIPQQRASRHWLLFCVPRAHMHIHT